MIIISPKSKQIVFSGFIIAAACLFLLGGLWQRPLMIPDECFLPTHPWLWGQVLKKLIAWFQPTAWLFSDSLPPTRLISYVFTVLSLLMTAGLAQHMFQHRAGLWASVVFATCTAVVLHSQLGTDLTMQVCGLQLLASTCLLYLHNQNWKTFVAFFITWVSVGTIVPWLVVLIAAGIFGVWVLQLWSFLSPRFRQDLLWGILGIALSIFCLRLAQAGAWDIEPFSLRHFFTNLVLSLVVGMFPWAAWLGIAYQHHHKVYNFYIQLFLVWVVGASFLVPTAGYTSTILGSLACMPPLAIIVGQYLDQRWTNRHYLTPMRTVWVLFGHLAIGTVLMTYLLFVTMNHNQVTVMWPWVIAMSSVFLIGAILSLALAYKGRSWEVTICVFLATTVFDFIALKPILPYLQPASHHHVAKHVLETLTPHDIVLTMGIEAHDLPVYLDHPVKAVSPRNSCPRCHPEAGAESVWDHWEGAKTIYLVLSTELYHQLREDECFADYLTHVLYTTPHVVVVTNRKVKK